MKIETLLNKARENAKKQVWLDYLDIIDQTRKRKWRICKIRRKRNNR